MELRDLPNRAGYRFWGVTYDGDVVACVVRRDPIGCHSVYRELDDAPFFTQLRGWTERNPDERWELVQ